MTIKRLLILSVLPLAIATVNVVAISKKTLATQSETAAESITPNSEQQEPHQAHRPGPPPDFAKAAQKLGISEEKLKEALGVPLEPPPPPPLDIPGAADKLKVSEDKLIEVLGLPPRPSDGCPPSTK